MSTFDIETFRNAAPYIYAHRDETFVISIDCQQLTDNQLGRLVQDLALIHTLGTKLVIVHGAGLAGNRSQGSPEDLIIDQAGLIALQQRIGQERALLESLFSTGLINTPMAGMKINMVSGNFVRAKPRGVINGVDTQNLGEVRRIDAHIINAHLNLRQVVLLSPLGYSATGECFYVDGAEIAAVTSATLRSDKLIFLTKQLSLRDSHGRTINHLSLARAQKLLHSRKTLSATVRKLIHLAIDACLNRVARVHLVNRNKTDALLTELYTHGGAGVMISTDDQNDIRPANIEDAGGILELIKPLEEKGILVPRTKEQIELDIHAYYIVEHDGLIICCGALNLFSPQNTAEVACLAVHTSYQHSGYGSRMLQHLEKKARELGINQLFVLTTQTLHWFREHGFKKCEIRQLPVARRKTYNYQRNSKVLMKTIG